MDAESSRESVIADDIARSFSPLAMLVFSCSVFSSRKWIGFTAADKMQGKAGVTFRVTSDGVASTV